MKLVTTVSLFCAGFNNANSIEGWMTAQVFIKLSSKLAAEQGVVGGLDGSLDSEKGTSYKAEDTALQRSIRVSLVNGVRRGLLAQKKRRMEIREQSKKRSYGNSTASTV